MTSIRLAPTEPDVGYLGAWHIVAIVALGITAGLIFLTASTDTCTSIGNALVFAGWRVTPVIALAALAAAAAAARRPFERYVAWTVTALLTVGWLGALAAASIGPVVHQVGC